MLVYVFQYWILVLNNQLMCFSLGKTISTLYNVNWDLVNHDTGSRVRPVVPCVRTTCAACSLAPKLWDGSVQARPHIDLKSRLTREKL